MWKAPEISKTTNQSPSFNLGFTYGTRYRRDRPDRGHARDEAWVRCTDGVDEREFNRGFDAGWNSNKVETRT
jgi:hypothetical protein